MPFLFYVSGSRRTSARGDAAHRNKPARARGARKPRRGDPFRGVGGALLSPPRRNTTNFAASDRALSDVCFYVGFSFSQKVLRYFLGALKCLVSFLFYASGSRRTSARGDAAHRNKPARARGARKPRRGAPLGVSAEPCCPHHVEIRRISQHPTERLSDVCFYVAFSQKVLRYFLGALKCLMPFLFYASEAGGQLPKRTAPLS